MKTTLNFNSGNFIDFAVGTVIKGKEAQVFQEYFPQVTPILDRLEISNVCSFAVLDSNIEGHLPEQGAFSNFKAIEDYNSFTNDPIFLKAKPIRDEGMTFLNDGNMFEAPEQTLTLDTEADYAIVLTAAQQLTEAPLLEMKLTQNTPKTFYQGKKLTLHNWNDETAKLLSSNPESTVVFRIRVFPKQN